MHKLGLKLLLTFALGLLSACNEKFVIKSGFTLPGNNTGNNTTTTISPSFAGRGYHTATTLANGKILIVGGENNDETLDLVQIYDPATNTLTTKAPLNVHRSEHTATLLENGKVLVVGGYNSDSNWDPIASAEIYDPSADTWTVVNDLPDVRCNHASVAISGNKVLVIGGYDINWDTSDSTYVYDVASGNWSSTTSMFYKRVDHTLAMLGNGTVMAVAGQNEGGILNYHEIFDPGTELWTLTQDSNNEFTYHDSVVLPNDKVMVMGGYASGWVLNDAVEIYDPASDTWSNGATLPVATSAPVAGLLSNNMVVVVGGNQSSGRNENLYIYDYNSDSWSTSGNLQQARSYHTLSVVGNDIIVTGGSGDSGYLKSIERFSAVSSSWSFVVAPPARIVSITPPADDNYVDGDILSFSLTYEEPVILTGNVKAQISTNNGVIYATATSSGAALTHTFQLVVDSSMQSDGIQIHGTMDLNGGSIVTVDDGAAADLDIPSENFSGVTINYKRPEIISVVAPPNGNYYEGYELEFTVTFDEPVTFTGMPYIWLEVGAGWVMLNSQTSGSSAVHVFKSYPLGNDTDLDGIVMQGTLNIAGADTVLSDSGIPAKTTFTPADVSGIMVPPRAAMNFNRSPGSYFATKLSDNRLVVVGGFDAGTLTATTHVEIFDPDTNTWTVLAPLNQGRGLQKVHELPNGNLVVFGGIGTNSATPIFDSTEVYDVGANTWTTVMPMSTPRYYPASILMSNGKILVMGGYTTGLGCVDSVEEFDPNTNTWVNKPAMVSGTQTSMTLVELADGSIRKTSGQCWGVSRADEVYVP